MLRIDVSCRQEQVIKLPSAKKGWNVESRKDSFGVTEPRPRGMQEEVGEENDDKWNPRSDNNKAHVLLTFTSSQSL